MPITQTPLEIEFEKLYTPFQKFVQDQTNSSAILVICVVLALLLANSPWGSLYTEFLHTPVGFVFNDLHFTMSLQHWINEGLMT